MMKISLGRKILIALVALSVVLGLVVSFTAHYLRGLDMISACSESVEYETRSPNQKSIATAYLRNCGATTGYVTHLNLRRADESAESDANGTIVRGEVLVVEGSIPLRFKWSGDDTLVVSLPASHGMPLTLRNEWNGVRVVLRTERW